MGRAGTGAAAFIGHFSLSSGRGGVCQHQQQLTIPGGLRGEVVLECVCAFRRGKLFLSSLSRAIGGFLREDGEKRDSEERSGGTTIPTHFYCKNYLRSHSVPFPKTQN